MKTRTCRILFLSFATLFIVAFIIHPVNAWSEVGVERVDDIDDGPGTQYPTENEALEGGSWGFYDFEVVFTILSVDQTADVYKIWIDSDGSDQYPPETLLVYYKWGLGSWTYLTAFAYAVEDKYTITDATSTTLYIKIVDYSNLFDFLRDKWSFGDEPVLWMYWY